VGQPATEIRTVSVTGASFEPSSLPQVHEIHVFPAGGHEVLSQLAA